MKKYFTKYLPVEGEIKEGDLVRNNLDGLIGNTIRPITQAEFNDKEYSKVKLFLCDKDIAVGDEITIIVNKVNGEDVPIQTKFHVNRANRSEVQNDNGLTLNRKDVVKVIGEISREATWVKEGDKFEHEEVALNGIWQSWNSRTPLGRHHIVFVKGPCGHFH